MLPHQYVSAVAVAIQHHGTFWLVASSCNTISVSFCVDILIIPLHDIFSRLAYS